MENEIERHLNEHPTRVEEWKHKFEDQNKSVENLWKKWDSFTTKALLVLLGGFCAMVGYGVWVGTINTKVEGSISQIIQHEAKILDIDRRQQMSDVSSAGVQAKLASIEASLIEIKASLLSLSGR